MPFAAQILSASVPVTIVETTPGFAGKFARRIT
jgi:hypothetical protein